MSEGDYVTLGANEVEDLACLVKVCYLVSCRTRGNSSWCNVSSQTIPVQLPSSLGGA